MTKLLVSLSCNSKILTSYESESSSQGRQVGSEVNKPVMVNLAIIEGRLGKKGVSVSKLTCRRSH